MLRKNARLLPVDKVAAKHMANELALALAKHARSIKEQDVPLCFWFTQGFRTSFDYTIPRTGQEVEVRVRLLSKEVRISELREIRDGKAYINCKDAVIVGGSLEHRTDIYMRDQLTHDINVYLCPMTTAAELKWANQDREIIEEIYSTLIHELTHAAEHGLPKEYTKDSREKYLNHDWEVRAFAQQIADEIVTFFSERPKKIREMRAAAESNAELLADVLWESDRYNRIYPALTEKNRRKVLQYIVRELQERGLI